MTATDPTITLAAIVKFEAPDGDVRLCDGGMLDFASERYESLHPVFGTVREGGDNEAGFGDQAEDGTLVLVPHAEASVGAWWRNDLFGCRIRAWMGEVDADGVTVSSATQISDLLVDTAERVQGEAGEDLLVLELVGRGDKLFLTNEGNVCSDTWHQSVYAGELGFQNCTDLRGFVAWGAANPPRSAGAASPPLGPPGLYGYREYWEAPVR